MQGREAPKNSRGTVSKNKGTPFVKSPIRLTVAALILAGLSRAHATCGPETSLEKAYRSAALELFQNAQTAGAFRHLEGTDLVRESEAVCYKEIPKLEKPEGALRFTAFNEPSTKTVYLNRSSLQPAPDRLGPLAAHETLGALGYKDYDYQVSLGLDFFTKAQALPEGEWKEETLRQLRIGLRRSWDLNVKTYETGRLPGEPDMSAATGGGGATGVGSGGDGDAIVFKALFINTLAKDRVNFRFPQVIYRIGLDLQIEFDPTIKRIVSEQVDVGMPIDVFRKRFEEVTKNQPYSQEEFEFWWKREREKKGLRFRVPTEAGRAANRAEHPESDPTIQELREILRRPFSGTRAAP